MATGKRERTSADGSDLAPQSGPGRNPGYAEHAPHSADEARRRGQRPEPDPEDGGLTQDRSDPDQATP